MFAKLYFVMDALVLCQESLHCLHTYLPPAVGADCSQLTATPWLNNTHLPG